MSGNLLPAACALLFSSFAAAQSPADTSRDGGARPQTAQGFALDERQIEESLYRQGYGRVSHIAVESGAYTARALDENGRPVFLGVSAQTGEVIEAYPLK